MYRHTENGATARHVVAKMLQSFRSYMRWARCTMRFNSVAP